MYICGAKRLFFLPLLSHSEQEEKMVFVYEDKVPPELVAIGVHRMGILITEIIKGLKNDDFDIVEKLGYVLLLCVKQFPREHSETLPKPIVQELSKIIESSQVKHNNLPFIQNLHDILYIECVLRKPKNLKRKLNAISELNTTANKK